MKIKGVQETALDEWIRTQIDLHSIGALPEELIETDLTRAAKCAVADLKGYLEYIDIPRDDDTHPAAKTRRELLAAVADFKGVSATKGGKDSYCAVAEYLADEGRKIFTGRMNGGLWNGRVLDACIMSKKEGDKAAYEFLLKLGDQYASTLSPDQQRQWQNIKGKATSMLKCGTEPGSNAVQDLPEPHTS